MTQESFMIRVGLFNVPSFREAMDKFGKRWNVTLIDYLTFYSAIGKRIVSIKYENIVSSDWNVKVLELLTLLRFLYSDQYWQTHIASNPSVLRQWIQKIICALSVTDDPRMAVFHRTMNESEKGLYIDRYTAYRMAGNRAVCSIWDQIGQCSSELGYSPINGVECAQ